MSSEEFWHGPFDLARAYREAWEIRTDVRFAEEWRQGYYTLRALSVALDHSFNRDATSEYPDAPLFSVSANREAEEEERRRRQTLRFREQLQARVARINERIAEGQGEAQVV